MAKKRSGRERIIKYGVAGSSAATIIENATDIDVSNSNSFNESTTRGDGSALPKKTEQPDQLAVEPTFSLRYQDSEATISALIAAARAGTAVAILVLRILGGEEEFDGDCYLEMSSPGPLTGGMDIAFTCHPTDDNGRAWTVG